MPTPKDTPANESGAPPLNLIEAMQQHRAHVEQQKAKMQEAAARAQQALNAATEEFVRLDGVGQGIDAMIELTRAQQASTPTPATHATDPLPGKVEGEE